MRKAGLIFGLCVVLAGIFASVRCPQNRNLGLETLALGILILGTVFFERRYKPNLTEASFNDSEWLATAERFADPSTGQTVAVRYNPRTGKRAYVALPATKREA